MKAKKIVSREVVNSVVVPVHAQPTMHKAAVHGQKTIFLNIAPLTPQERHLNDARCALALEETMKAGLSFLSCFDTAFKAALFSPVALYEKHLQDIAELRLRREKERRLALGLLETVVPAAWKEYVSSKDTFTSSLFGWLTSLAREFKQDDAYQIELEDCIEDLPSYDRHGHVASKTDKAKHFHAIWGKARSALLPLVDRYTGEVKRPGCPDCKMQIERIKGVDGYMVYFTK